MLRTVGFRLILWAAAAAMAGCSPAAMGSRPEASGGASEAPAPVIAEVVRSGETWAVTYRLPRAAPVWPFIRSAPVAGTTDSWRARSWTVETPGVRLERVGRYDALVAAEGNVPSTVRIRFRPFTEELESDYVPAHALTDGTLALFDDHFAIFSVASREEAAALPADLNGQPIADSGTAVGFRDTSGPLLHGGRRHEALTLRNSSSYVFFNARNPVETDAIAAMIDPQLPDWLKASLRDMVPAILGRHAADLGPAPAGKPMLLASWAGPTAGKFSMNGGVVPGTVLMRFEGEGLLAQSRQMRDLARWFIAHEGAHFWLGQAVRYERSRDAWITEGGADLLAVRAVQSIDREYDWRRELNRSIRDCIALSRGRGIGSAEDRGENRAYYACGALFGLLVEAESGRPFSAFIRSLIDANRADGVLTRQEWLDRAREATRDADLIAWIERTIDLGHDDPAASVAAMLSRAGIAFTRAEDGALRLQ
jgi:hypothetical protein